MLPGPKLLRPYQLGFRTDFGLPGFADPFDMVELMELVLSQGLLANSSFFLLGFALYTFHDGKFDALNLMWGSLLMLISLALRNCPSGFQQRRGLRLLMSHCLLWWMMMLKDLLLKAFVCKHRCMITSNSEVHKSCCGHWTKRSQSPTECEGQMLPPFGVAFVKGWRRSLALLISLEGIRQLGIPTDELTSVFKAGWSSFLGLSPWHEHANFIWPSVLPGCGQASLKVVHGTVGKFSTTKDAVHAARGQSC